MMNEIVTALLGALFGAGGIAAVYEKYVNGKIAVIQAKENENEKKIQALEDAERIRKGIVEEVREQYNRLKDEYERYKESKLQLEKDLQIAQSTILRYENMLSEYQSIIQAREKEIKELKTQVNRLLKK